MLAAALAPEYILVVAVVDFFRARSLLGQLVTHGGNEWTLVHAEFAVAGGIRVRDPGSDQIKPDFSGSALREAVESGLINEPPISKEELKSRSKSDGVVKLIALLQITWFGCQALFRAIQHLQVTALEIMTVAFVFLTVLIYAIWWNKPQDIEYPIIITLQNMDANGTNGSQGENVGTKSPGDAKLWLTDQKYKAFLVDQNWAFIVVFALIGPLFGAIHCLAWDAPFPTSMETLAWRICSVATTSLPLVEAALFSLDNWATANGLKYQDSGLSAFIIIFTIVLYAIPRITLIILAFMSLRALPADAFRTITWTKYLPNLGV